MKSSEEEAWMRVFDKMPEDFDLFCFLIDILTSRVA